MNIIIFCSLFDVCWSCFENWGSHWTFVSGSRLLFLELVGEKSRQKENKNLSNISLGCYPKHIFACLFVCLSVCLTVCFILILVKLSLKTSLVDKGFFLTLQACPFIITREVPPAPSLLPWRG